MSATSNLILKTRMSSLEFSISLNHMVPLKWKIYRVLNYLLLCSGFIFLLHFLRLVITAFDRTFLSLSILFSLLFLFMVSHALINIIIMAKTFPDRGLNPNKNRWHIFSLALNLISVAGLIITFFTVMSEIADDYFNGLLVILGAITIFVLSSLFILICQFNLRKYLKQKNASLMNSLIDSIGRNSQSHE